MDLYKYTYDLVRQIPKGKVSTYGAVAKALGDIRASRAVGQMMNQNPHPDKMPCYKIVYSDGRVGGFALGPKEKVKRLKQDNIAVKDGKILDFESVLFTDFKTDYPLKTCRKEQLQLRNKVNLTDQLNEDEIFTIAGFDVAYSTKEYDKACVACVIIEYNTKNIIETKTMFQQTKFPYIPTYLTFRETPLIQQLYTILDHEPTVLMFDGNGILHPYQFGLASHAGVLLNKPSIGVAKSLLCGKKQENDDINYQDKILGKALYAHNHQKKPVYVSPGNLISLSTSYKIASNLSTYKHPKPVRQAHILATKTMKSY
jgi:deoxyribonuclease V